MVALRSFKARLSPEPHHRTVLVPDNRVCRACAFLRRRSPWRRSSQEPAPRFQDPEAPRPGYDRQRAAFGAMAVHKARRESSRRRAERQVRSTWTWRLAAPRTQFRLMSPLT